MHRSSDWSAQQLAEYLAALSSYSDERSAVVGAIERAAEAVEAEVAALVHDGHVVVTIGFSRGLAPIDDLLAVVTERREELDVTGVGTCHVLLVPLEGALSGTLLLARSGESFGQEESGLVRGMARVLGLTVETFRVVDRERTLRLQSEEQVAENSRLVDELRERQHLLERLFKIQRSISHRAPIQSVLDAITEGAAELLGDEVVGLRLIDEHDPQCMVMVSAVGVDETTFAATRCARITEGVSGRAIVEQRVVSTNDDGESQHELPHIVDSGLHAAMAVPVYRNGSAAGSLMVATRRPDRLYSATEQEMLLAFAEHASLALNDASAVDAMRRAFGEAVHQATHDALTGLPNRTLVVDRLTHALARSRRKPNGPAVLFVDLDRFKVVNDSLGHSIGDEVLIQVAERMQAAVRPSDTVSRLAGDEFVVVCEEVDGECDVLIVADRVAQAVAAPMQLYGRETIITASIGIVIAAPDARAEDLLRDADVAMYRAKERGRARFEMFDQEMRTRMLERLETEQALRRAIQDGQLDLYYQPTVCLETGRVTALEALVRWNHPDRGLVLPDEFVPLAEDTGLIIPLGRWVLEEACRRLAGWHRDYPELGPIQVSVNLSARQFADVELLGMVAGVLDASGLDPSSLWLEITESVLMEEAEATVDTLRALRSLGVHLSIDDFGTGYSSLSYLKRFPVDVLKIDRSFVDGLGTDPEDEAIVGAVVSLSRALNLGVVAEGVETAEQLAELRRLGCTSVQGFYFGCPRPAEETLRLLTVMPVLAAS